MKSEDPKLIVALYLRGELLDPEQVTKHVRITPSKTQKKGDVQVTPTGHKVVAKHGLWAFLVELDSPSLNEHIAQLASSLTSELHFSSITDVEEAYIDIFMAITSDSDGDASCELEVSPTSLKFLAELGLTVRISVTAGRE